MAYYITPREDDSRHYDIMLYDKMTPFIFKAILRGDSYGDTIYVDNKEFGTLMRKRDFSNIHLDSSRRVKYVKKYNATVSKDHRLHPDNIGVSPEYQ